MSDDAATTGEKQGNRFAKGKSGNPAGRAKGARHAALVPPVIDFAVTF